MAIGQGDFIPKQCSTSYDQDKFFRPITLPFFLLKMLESMIDKNVRDNMLVQKPMYSSQENLQKRGFMIF